MRQKRNQDKVDKMFAYLLLLLEAFEVETIRCAVKMTNDMLKFLDTFEIRNDNNKIIKNLQIHEIETLFWRHSTF